MKSFEPVMNKLNKILIDNLPECIDEINIVYNDGVILQYFENKDIFSNINKRPCFIFATENAKYTDKDIIIENSVYEVSLSLMLPNFGENRFTVMWRYVEAIQNLINKFNKCEAWNIIKIERVSKNVIFLRIVI